MSAASPRRFGKYILLDKLAEGGMAEIFLALEQTPHTGRRFVIIKRIRPGHDADADYVDFFLNEGRVSIQCAHPNLPQVYELDVIDGVHYLAMELIRGHTLLDLLRGAARKRELVSVPTAMAMAMGVAAALEHAHALADADGTHLAVIHRDVTPQNVMLSSAGFVKLIDFGIVRSAVQRHETQTGVVKGKFSYLAPEQIESARTVDHRTDLFALGVVLHETLLGRPLFRGATDARTIDNVLRLPIADPAMLRPDVPPALGAAVCKALQRSPDRRFQSATEFLLALDEVAAGAGVHVSPMVVRREVERVCGPPPAVAVPPGLRAPAASEHGAADAQPGQSGTALPPPLPSSGAGRLAHGSCSEVDAGAQVGGDANAVDASDSAQAAGAENLAERDPELVRYLNKAGATLPSGPMARRPDAQAALARLLDALGG